MKFLGESNTSPSHGIMPGRPSTSRASGAQTSSARAPTALGSVPMQLLAGEEKWAQPLKSYGRFVTRAEGSVGTGHPDSTQAQGLRHTGCECLPGKPRGGLFSAWVRWVEGVRSLFTFLTFPPRSHIAAIPARVSVFAAGRRREEDGSPVGESEFPGSILAPVRPHELRHPTGKRRTP